MSDPTDLLSMSTAHFDEHDRLINEKTKKEQGMNVLDLISKPEAEWLEHKAAVEERVAWLRNALNAAEPLRLEALNTWACEENPKAWEALAKKPLSAYVKPSETTIRPLPLLDQDGSYAKVGGVPVFDRMRETFNAAATQNPLLFTIYLLGISLTMLQLVKMEWSMLCLRRMDYVMRGGQDDYQANTYASWAGMWQ